MSGHCIEQSLPSRADLVLVEGVSYLQSISTGRVGPGQPSDEAAMASGLEGLLLRLQGHYRSLPPVVLLTTHHLTGPDAASGRCLQAQLNSGSPAAECCKQFAHLLGANPSGPFLQHLRVEHIYSKLAAHYGLTALSLRDFYRHVFDAGQHTAAGLNECEFLRLMHRDAVHLRPLAEGGLGMLLWADLLISVLADAEELMARQAAAAAPDQRPGLHVGAGATAAAQAQAQLLAAAGGLPRKRLYRATGDAFRMRCYGGPRTEKAGFGAAAEANDANAANGIAAHGMAASRRGQLGPGHVPFQLKVLNNSGWNHVEYQIHGTSRKYKPGWVALRPGDRMTVQLDTLWDNATFTAPPTPPPPWQTAGLTVHHAKVAVNPYLLGVTFLRSYQHMGRVAIACTAGCSCAPQQLDGHHADPVSSEHYAEFPVSQHPACTLTFTILPGTSSGQHKFKLIQVVSKQRVADADG